MISGRRLSSFTFAVSSSSSTAEATCCSCSSHARDTGCGWSHSWVHLSYPVLFVSLGVESADLLTVSLNMYFNQEKFKKNMRYLFTYFYVMNDGLTWQHL